MFFHAHPSSSWQADCFFSRQHHAFRLDDETVRDWLKKSGQHCQQVYEHCMAHCPLGLGQVQADEIKVKMQRGSVWMALGLMVGPRLWLGGVVGAARDPILLRGLAG